MMIATAILNVKEIKFTTESLLFYLNSYGCRIQDIQKINFILQTNINAIQYFINNNTTITMARYTETNKIIQFIGVEENEDIVSCDTKKLNILAKNYVKLKYREKLGKKILLKKLKIPSKYYKAN